MTPERVQACLERSPGVRDAMLVAPGPRRSSGNGMEKWFLKWALRGSYAAIQTRFGGGFYDPISNFAVEAPLQVVALHFFRDLPRAQSAGRVARLAAGSPRKKAFNGVRVFGPVLVLHWSFSIGGRPGHVGIEQDLEPIESCLRRAGYLHVRP